MSNADPEPLPLFETLRSLPEAIARRTDPETSHAAARTAGQTRRTLGPLVIETLRRTGPLNDFDSWLAYCDHSGESPSRSSWGRTRGAMVAAGRVVWSGDYSTTDTGSQARTWRVVAAHEPGYAVPIEKRLTADCLRVECCDGECECSCGADGCAHVEALRKLA